jgi:8-oxo-dGTP diphosphatase
MVYLRCRAVPLLPSPHERCGEIPADADITLDAGELDAWAFLAPDEAAARVPANVAPRITAALRARTRGETTYLAGGRAT